MGRPLTGGPGPRGPDEAPPIPTTQPRGETASIRRAAERRAWPRTSLLGAGGDADARLLPGWYARVIDLSAGGALIETECRLLPGAQVELQLVFACNVGRVRGRIIRSHVAALDRQGGIRYRGGLMFDEALAPRRSISASDG